MKKYTPLIVLAIFAIGVLIMITSMQDISAKTTQGVRAVQK